MRSLSGNARKNHEVRPPIVADFNQREPAARTSAAFSTMRKQPGFRQTIEIGFQRNCSFQNMARCTKTIASDPCHLNWAAAVAGWMHATEKNFVGVKVADPGDQLLVEQNRFHGAAMREKDRFELGATNIERVRTDAASLQKLIHILDQLDLAKFSVDRRTRAGGCSRI